MGQAVSRSVGVALDGTGRGRARGQFRLQQPARACEASDQFIAGGRRGRQLAEVVEETLQGLDRTGRHGRLQTRLDGPIDLGGRRAFRLGAQRGQLTADPAISPHGQRLADLVQRPAVRAPGR